jgi:hypothetical protein
MICEGDRGCCVTLIVFADRWKPVGARLDVAAFKADCEFALDGEGLCTILSGARHGKRMEAGEKSGN